MNHYGAQMMRHWQEERPGEFGELEDPDSWFSQLGEQIAQAVEERARSLAVPVSEPEGYLARLQRLNSARLMAESEVVREYLLPEPGSR